MEFLSNTYHGIEPVATQHSTGIQVRHYRHQYLSLTCHFASVAFSDLKIAKNFMTPAPRSAPHARTITFEYAISQMNTNTKRQKNPIDATDAEHRITQFNTHVAYTGGINGTSQNALRRYITVVRRSRYWYS